MPQPAPVVDAAGRRGIVERIPELDALRGIAALGVAVYHYTQRYDELYGHKTRIWGDPWIWEFLPFGRYGVQLFFLISGFVILLSVSRAKSAREFAVQRAARLYPAFWVACLLTWGVVQWLGLTGREVPAGTMALNLTMVPLWFKSIAPGVWYVDGAYWSLKEELLFYVLIAGVLLMRVRRHALWVVAGLIGLHIVGADTSAWLAEGLGFRDARQMYSSFSLRWFSLFAVGIVLFECLMRGGFRWRRHGVVLALAVVDLMPMQEVWPRVFAGRPGLGTWEHFGVVVVSAGLVWVAARYRPRVLRARPLVYLGAISYSLYLLHQNIGYVVIRECEERGMTAVAAVVVALVTVIVLASALTFGVERPVYGVVRRWLKGREGVKG